MPDVSSALAYLNQTPSVGTNGSVCKHITQALQKILAQSPADALSLFESTILQLDHDNAGNRAHESAADAALTVAQLGLYGDPQPSVRAEGEPEEVPEPTEYAFFEPEAPELVAGMMQLAGCGLNQAEMYGVLMVMKRLGSDADKKVEALRFFGKFFGLRADYYVFECRMNERPAKPDASDADAELPPGQAPPEEETGANKYLYFVCNTPGGPLTLLDDVLPAHIRGARLVTKLLTGSLDAPVSAFPPFPGRERHYLRAQIARIAHTTVLCPKGLYVAPAEEGGELEANEEYKVLPVTLMGDCANWSHWTPHIKAMGVTVLPELPEPEDEEKPPQLLPEQTEKGPAALATADSDARVLTMPPWIPVVSSCSKNAKFQVAGVTSTLWPGATALTNGSVWANFYVGWGVKRQEPYVPLPPPALAQDAVPSQECNDLPSPPSKPEEAEAEE